MKVKFYNRKMEFIAIKDCESVSYTRQKNKEYSISFTPIVSDRYDFSDVYFFSLLDDNADKDKRLTFLPCGVLTDIDINNKCSGNSIEHYLQNISVLPENWGWWGGKTLKSVLQDHIYGFRTYRKASFTELSDAVYSHHVEVATLENGNGEVYAGTADYRNVPTSELYYYSDGYIIYRMQVPTDARRAGMVLRWADITGGNTDIGVQFRWSETGNDYTGEYSAEQSPVRGEDIKPNETAGIDIPESSMGYLFIRFNLKYNTGTISEAHLRGINYDNEVTSVEEGTSTILYYGTTAILNAFEVVYRVETHFSLGDFVLSDTKLNQADISESTNLLESLKAICEAYNISFFCTLSGGTIALNCYDAYVNDTTNDFVVSDVINASVQSRDVAIDLLQAVEAFGAGTGLDRIHTFVKLDEAEEDITNIGTFEDSDIYNESDLITAAKEYISTQNEGLSSATFEYYNHPISMYDKVKAVIKGKVYTSTITEEKVSIDGESAKKSYTIGIKEYPFRTLYSNPFGGTYLAKPPVPSNITTKRTYEGWVINWKGTTGRYIMLYRVSGESVWNSFVANNSSVIISNVEYNKTYEFKVYAVSVNNVLSDATEIQYANSGDETGFQTASVLLYKRASSIPSKPANSLVYTFVDSTLTGDKDEWSDEFVANDGNPLYVTKYTAVSKESSVTIASADWSTPVLLVDNGSDGEAGYRTTSIELFQWASETPVAFPSGSSTFNWVDGTFTLPLTLNGWSLTGGTASEGQNLYRVRQVYTDNGTSLTSTIVWSATSSISVGTAGENGTRRAVLELYKWSEETPTSFPSGTSIYTWETGSFTLPSTLNGWAINAGNGNEGESLYYCFMVYTDKDTTETSSVSWSTNTAYKTGYNGISGETGKSVYVASIYKQSSSTPETPTNGTYNFGTGVLTPPSGWSITQPATTTTPTYIAEFRFIGDTPTSIVTAGAWTTPVVDAVAGSDGDDGYSQDRVYVYYQGSTVPTAPTGGTYKLSDGTLVVPTGGGSGVTWSGTQPTSSTSPTYKTSALFRSKTPTVAVAPTGAWSTPIITAQNGSDGSDATAQVITSPTSTTPNATMVYPNVYYGIYQGSWYKWDWTNETTGYWTYTDVTPITDSWAYYKGHEIPELPDNVAGTTYKRDKDWTTTDGWAGNAVYNIVSAENNFLKVVYAGTTGQSLSAYKTVATNAKMVIGIVNASVPITNVKYYNGTLYTSLSISKITDYRVMFYGYISTSFSQLYISTNNGNTVPATAYYETIYIGTGAYDTLVFDNSYHLRHLINNAVIPTPQGLSFNGVTSYLRSRDKITLPDVFTFRAVVNCAVKSASQTIITQGPVLTDAPQVFLYRTISQDTLNFRYYTAGGQVARTIGSNVFTGLDNKDVIIELTIDSVLQKLSCHINRVFIATYDITGFIKPTSAYIYLGYQTSMCLLGYMKDIQMYDHALTDAERNWLAQGNELPTPYTLVDYVQEQIDDDGVVSANEKPAILSKWLSIYALNPASSALTTTSTAKDGEYSAIVSEALSAGLVASDGEVVAYLEKTNAIRAFCFTTSTGVLVNMNVSSAVTVGAWDTLIAQYNTAFTNLRTAITNQRITSSSGLSPQQSNGYHQFPTASDGSVLSYLGSGNTLQVFEGVGELQAVTGTPTAGQYAVTATGTNITAGSKSVSGKTMVFADTSAFTAGQTSAYIQFVITGKSTNDTAFTIYRTQTFSKALAGSDGSRFYIMPSVSQVIKDKTGTLTPSSVSATRYQQIASASPVVSTAGTLKYMLSTESTETATSNGTDIAIGSALWIEFYFYDASAVLMDRQRVNVLTDGTDGTNGTDGQIISIVRSVSAIKKDKANVPSVSSVIFSFLSKSGESAAIAYSGYYKAYRRAKNSETFTLVTSGAGTSYTFVIGTDTYEEYKVELYTDSEYASKTDEQSILALFELGGNVKVDLSNQSSTVPTDSAGANGVFIGTPTAVHVYEGITELIYDGTGTSNGTWTIGTPTLSGCTGSSITDSEIFATLNAITAMSADVATRTLPITGKTANGTSFTLSIVQTLTKNKQGVQGDAGIGIASTTIKYVASTSGTVIPSSGWQDTIPVITAGQFLWTWTKIVYTDSVDHVTDSYSVGMAGNEGKGISSAVVNYAVNSSGTVEPEIGWSPSVPSVTAGQYLWSRTVTTYTDATASTVYSVSYQAIDASFYSVETSTSAINRDKLGVITNASVTFNAYRTVGNTRSAYSGYWTTQQSVDGSNWTNINNTSAISSSATIAKVNISSTAKWVRAIVYAEAGRTTLRDYEDIPIVTDGSENIIIDVSNRVINIPVGLDNKPLSNGSFSSLVRVFRGTTELAVTTGFTIAVSSANGWTATKSGATVTITTSTATAITNLGFSLPITVTVGSTSYTENISLSATPKGLTGTGVASSEVKYVASTSGTVIPSTGWVTSPPTVPAGQYLWTWTRINYTAGSPTDTYSVGMMGNEGRGVESTAVTYMTSTSGTTAPETGWTSSIPSVTAGQYLWTRTIITYTEAPLTSTSYSVSYKAINGTSVFTGFIYKQVSPAPAAPTGGKYNFTSGVLTPPTGWSITQPASSETATYRTQYNFIATTPGATITATTWATPVLDAQKIDGTTQDTIEVYYQGSTAPTAPTGGTYIFTTSTLVVPTGGGSGVTWSATKQASSITPTYVTRAMFKTRTPDTAVAPTGSWSAPVVIAQNGSNAIVMTSASAPSGTYVGQLGEYSSLMYRWTGNAWNRITAINWGLLTTAPSSGMIKDDTYTNSVTTITYKYDGSAWVAITQAVASVTPKYLGALTSLPSSYTIGDFFVVQTTFSTYTIGKIYYRSGSAWVLDENYQSERYSKAMIDLLAIAAGTGDQILCSHIATNSAFIGSLKTISALFGDYVASASSENPAVGDKIISMGKAPVKGIENPDEFAFLIAEKLGENSWMKHLWTKKETLGALAGLISLVMSGCVYAPTVKTGLGDIWTTQTTAPYSLKTGIIFNDLIIAGDSNGNILTGNNYNNLVVVYSGDSQTISCITGWKGNLYASTASGKILKSQNGISWTVVYTGIYGAGYECSAQNESTLSFFGVSAYTTDGINFTRFTGYGITHAIETDGVFYGFTYYGEIYTSNNLYTWSLQSRPLSVGTGYPSRGNGLTIRAGNGGELLYSKNNITWQSDVIEGLDGYSALASTYINGIFYVVFYKTSTSNSKLFAFSKIGEYRLVYSGTKTINQILQIEESLLAFGFDYLIQQGSGRGVIMQSSYLEAGAGIISQQINENDAVIKFSGGLCLQAGTHQWIGSVGAGGVVTRDVVFDDAFDYVPFAVLCTPSSSGSSAVTSSTYNVTAEQFSYVYVNRNSSASITNGTVHWVALGVKS